nr:MAG: ORF1 [TTV-like mini virus]
MPYYPWWRRRYPRRRFRWFRRRRTGRFIRPNYRRRRWVRKRYRKRKLSKITVKTWQPTYIKKAHVKGFYPAFLTNHYRVSHNLTQYIDATAPEHWPGGGGFAITQFTLAGLYELFLKAQNVWTKSNCNYPLIRYYGCRIKFYKAENFDYVAQIHRCTPLKSTDLLYMSTQPSIAMLNKHSILIPCKKYNRNKKNYKSVFVKPPTQMSTNWYFQKDLTNTPLLVITTTAASFDRYYLSSAGSSTTIGLTSLNTKSFTQHDFQEPGTQGYQPQPTQWLYGTLNGEDDPNNEPVKNLVYLGDANNYKTGVPITNSEGLNKLPTNGNAMWGNPFHPHYLSGEGSLYITNKNLTEVKNKFQTDIQTVRVKNSEYFTPKTTPNLVKCRYNPLQDKGVGNKIYLVSNQADHTQWQPPNNPLLMRENLPLWALCWGWMDWQKKQAQASQPDINYLTVIQSKFITPYLPFYVFLDQNFLDGNSPFMTGDHGRTDSDNKHWYPKNTFQIMSLNEIASCGPGVIKLQQTQSAEAHYEYNFFFKMGGCQAPMETVCDPKDQPIYPIPNTKQTTPSLQSPDTPIQTYLWDFDQRRDQITERAAKRIKKDWDSEQTVLQIAGKSSMELPAPHQETSPSETSDSEEEKETPIHKQLRLLRRKQKHLRRRILQLLEEQNL